MHFSFKSLLQDLLKKGAQLDNLYRFHEIDLTRFDHTFIKNSYDDHQVAYVDNIMWVKHFILQHTNNLIYEIREAKSVNWIKIVQTNRKKDVLKICKILINATVVLWLTNSNSFIFV